MITSIALGISLAACCGLRVFLPLLLVSLATRYFGFELFESVRWIRSDAAFICFATAALVEALASLIPGLDHLLDLIATPASFIAGSLMTIGIWGRWLSPDSPELKLTQLILPILIGGGSAGLVQLGTSLFRLGSTKTSAGLANPFFSKVETLSALAGTLLSFWAPFLSMGIFLIFVLLLVYLFYRRRKPRRFLPKP